MGLVAVPVAAAVTRFRFGREESCICAPMTQAELWFASARMQQGKGLILVIMRQWMNYRMKLLNILKTTKVLP